MAYTDKDAIEKLLLIEIDDSFDTQLTEWISAITNWINKFCDRTFEAASEDRYYDGNGKDRILIDSFVGTPTVVQLLNLDGSVQRTLTEGAGNDYVAYPLNTTEKNEIVLTPNSPVRRFSRAYFEDILDDEDINNPSMTERRLLKITASFGASTTVPDDIKYVATKLVAKIIQTQLKGTDGAIKSERLGDYSITFGDIDAAGEIIGVESILERYRDPVI